ncbi:hypothetical protein ['Paenibacillus yunnanensis' Narsing Rao et al. 2020]|uniref:hypothetical protein n=1 Tax=Paenibacillus tengchongensis TaxID=2608684 RepID=UPI0016523F6E|nr:hypothetical protein [Paenibacillus tengchongensis]
MKAPIIRSSPIALTLSGKPDQIKAVLAGWIRQYGRDMPLVYVLRLHAGNQASAPKAG